MSTWHRSSAVLVVAGALLGAAACNNSESRPEAEPPTTTTTTVPRRPGIDGALALGQLAPLTGSVSVIANAFTTPVGLAVEEMNLTGGVNGKPVGLIVADDGSALTTAVPSFTKLVDVDQVDAIIGPSSSEIAADLIPLARKSQVVLCSGSNSAGALSSIRSGGFYFRTAPPDQVQADALAQLIVNDGRQRPVIIAPRDSYGVPFGGDLRRELAAHGVNDTTLVTYRPAADPGAAVERALETDPDAIVVLGFPDGTAPALRTLAIQGKGPTQIPTYAADGLQSADLGLIVDPANPAVVAGLKGTTPAGVPAGIDHPFYVRMLAAGVEPFFSASTYDCAILVGLAAIGAESDDPVKIRDQFARNLRGKVECRAFLDCRTLLEAGRTIRYRGAFSKYDGFRVFEPNSGAFDIWTIGLDGRPVLAPPDAQIVVPGS